MDNKLRIKLNRKKSKKKTYRIKNKVFSLLVYKKSLMQKEKYFKVNKW